jgi:hypothetical protein
METLLETSTETPNQAAFLKAAEDGNTGIIISYLKRRDADDLLLVIGKATTIALGKRKMDVVTLLLDETSAYPVLKKYHGAKPQKNLETTVTF